MGNRVQGAAAVLVGTTLEDDVDVVAVDRYEPRPELDNPDRTKIEGCTRWAGTSLASRSASAHFAAGMSGRHAPGLIHGSRR
jgi:hypothetical protein